MLGAGRGSRERSLASWSMAARRRSRMRSGSRRSRSAGGTLAATPLDAPPQAPLPMPLRPAAAGPGALACLAAGRRSLRALLDAIPATTLPAAEWRALDPGGETLRDIDTPGDLAR